MLSERDKAVLDFERSSWLLDGPKHLAIRELLSMSSTKYYQTLRALAENPDALDYDPMTVRRLREAGRRSVVRRKRAAGDQ
ncbi:MAG: DUF3263 domain-containing protein [Acidimicrobiia bacterium]|nr:DUF3263 domain-containing protein [Acidimicrobiia bacterium]